MLEIRIKNWLAVFEDKIFLYVIDYTVPLKMYEK